MTKTKKPTAVYLVTNLLTGNNYLGISANPKERWATHQRHARKGSDCVFHRALRKYPEDQFRWEILTWCETFKAACELEVWGRAMGIGTYNMTSGGEGASGVVCSEATRKKLSLALKDRYFSPEHRERISLARKGHSVSAECREKLRQAITGTKLRPLTAEHKAKLSKAHTGKKRPPQTEQHKEKNRQAQLGKVMSAEARLKTSLAARARSIANRLFGTTFGKPAKTINKEE